MNSGTRKFVSIALIGVLVVAAAAIVLASGALKPSQLTTTLTDASGTTVTVNDTPERIVSCSPSITEMVCSLGLADKLVAVTNYDDYPAEAKALRDAGNTIGGFSNPSFEKILNYTPDMVLLEAGAPGHDDLAGQLRALNYTVIVMYAQENLNDVYKCIDLLGQATGKQATASQTISEMKAKITAIGSKVDSEPTTPDVMFVVYANEGFEGVYVAGGNTAIDEIVGLAGGNNVFDNLDGFKVASQEELIQKAATVDYIVMTIMYSTWQPEEISAWFKADSAWKNSPAVENNNVFFLTGQGESIFNRQSVRTVDAVQLMAEILHPSAFESEVPHNATGVNIIGDEYEEYLTSETSAHAASATMAAAVSKN